MLWLFNLLLFVALAAVVVGVIIYLLQQAPGADPTIKAWGRWIILVIAFVGVLWLVFGGGGGVPQLIGR